MPTHLHSVVFDAADPPGLARFWAALTGWTVSHEGPDEVVVGPSAGAGLPLVFVPVDDPKVVKNRVHIDLDSRSADDQAALVDLALGAGATRADIGQGATPWVVLADPEGNELCVLDPRPDYAEAGAIAAIVLDTPDPGALAPFWAAATGYAVETQPDGDVRLVPPGGRGPRLELLRNDDPKVAKNRVHLDVAPGAADDHGAEVERLRALGATDADVGQGRRPWTVLADPHGNELCVLGPRDRTDARVI
ncbi:MAG TPA: VOC family protein [Acidimicrobiales bacterium]|nr:VOC family protein [Acidimicrobiales bacterium]